MPEKNGGIEMNNYSEAINQIELELGLQISNDKKEQCEIILKRIFENNCNYLLNKVLIMVTELVDHNRWGN